MRAAALFVFTLQSSPLKRDAFLFDFYPNPQSCKDDILLTLVRSGTLPLSLSICSVTSIFNFRITEDLFVSQKGTSRSGVSKLDIDDSVSQGLGKVLDTCRIPRLL